RFAILGMTLHARTHPGEERAYAFASGGFDRNRGLDLGEDIENFGIHLLNQRLVSSGAERIANRVRVRGAVRDYRDAADTEQRSTAVLMRVELGAHLGKLLAHQKIRKPPAPVRREQLAQIAEHERGHAFHRLERDVASESVSDDDVGLGPIDIAS